MGFAGHVVGKTWVGPPMGYELNGMDMTWAGQGLDKPWAGMAMDCADYRLNWPLAGLGW